MKLISLSATFLLLLNAYAQAQDTVVTAPGVEVRQNGGEVIVKSNGASDVHVETQGGQGNSAVITQTTQTTTTQDTPAIAAKTSYANGKLDGMDFSNRDLSGSNFANASLVGANFTGSNLTRVNFANANLTGTNFTGSILVHANLANSNMTGAILTGADMSSANLSHATMNHAPIPVTHIDGGTAAHGF